MVHRDASNKPQPKTKKSRFVRHSVSKHYSLLSLSCFLSRLLSAHSSFLAWWMCGMRQSRYPHLGLLHPPTTGNAAGPYRRTNERRSSVSCSLLLTPRACRTLSWSASVTTLWCWGCSVGRKRQVYSRALLSFLFSGSFAAVCAFSEASKDSRRCCATVHHCRDNSRKSTPLHLCPG